MLLLSKEVWFCLLQMIQELAPKHAGQNLDRQEKLLSGVNPSAQSVQPATGNNASLTFGAVAVPAGIVGDFHIAAMLAGVNVAAQRRSPALLNSSHSFRLCIGELVILTILPTIKLEDVLQFRHLPHLLPWAFSPAFSAGNPKDFLRNCRS